MLCDPTLQASILGHASRIIREHWYEDRIQKNLWLTCVESIRVSL